MEFNFFLFVTLLLLFAIVGFELRASCLLDRRSAI
jgi:hypothetical protein